MLMDWSLPYNLSTAALTSLIAAIIGVRSIDPPPPPPPKSVPATIVSLLFKAIDPSGVDKTRFPYPGDTISSPLENKLIPNPTALAAAAAPNTGPIKGILATDLKAVIAAPANVLKKSFDLSNQFKIDLYEYEEDYFNVIDKLMLLMWGESAYDIINYYLYDRFSLDGSLNILYEEQEEGPDKEIFLKTSEDLYNYLIKIYPDFLK
jgi:hypothetical protein